MRSKNLNRLIPILGIVCYAASAFAQTESKPLTIGDPAPELIVKWVKGKPFKMNEDKLYVIEFWATWCGPCKAAMPHLSELAKKYTGKVEFLGVNIFESGYLDKSYEEFLPKIEKFVKEMGDKMAYNVAMDTNKLYMTNRWMKAAGQGGIPTGFLVKDGKVIWIGHPGDLDKTIEATLNGTYDVADFGKKFKESNESARKMEPQVKIYTELSKKVESAIEVKNYSKALAMIQEVDGTLDLRFKPAFQYLKLKALVRSDQNQFIALASEMKKADKNMTSIVADVILKVKEGGLPEKLYSFAIQCYNETLNENLSPSVPTAYFHNWIAYCYDRSHRPAEAIASQTKAIELATDALATGKYAGRIDNELIENYKKRLEEFKKGSK